MDLRLGPTPRMRIIPRPEDGLRAVMNQARERAPQAEQRRRAGWKARGQYGRG